jgi:hypothetical protein
MTLKVSKEDIEDEALEIINTLSKKGYSTGNIGYLITLLMEHAYYVEEKKDEYQVFLRNAVDMLDE